MPCVSEHLVTSKSHAKPRQVAHTHTHTHTRARARARTHTHTHAHCLHTRAPAQKHTHTHTHTHTHWCIGIFRLFFLFLLCSHLLQLLFCFCSSFFFFKGLEKALDVPQRLEFDILFTGLTTSKRDVQIE